MRTRIKICGVTRPEDGVMAARLGADAIGLVCYPPSSRYVSVEQAQSIVTALPPFVTSVALFLDPAPEEVAAVIEAVPVGMLQFHGGESPQLCEQWSKPYLKAVPMGAGVELDAYAARYARAAGLLLDSHREGAAGGSGTAFDWTQVPGDVGRPVVLAGGLTPDNVAEAMASVRPYAVDVSSGVESAKGIKSAEKMETFIRSVRSGDAEHTPGPERV